MRAMTIRDAVKYYREQDPNTPITETGIMGLVNSGAIHSCKVGAKTFVTLETIEEYFSGRASQIDESEEHEKSLRFLSTKAIIDSVPEDNVGKGLKAALAYFETGKSPNLDPLSNVVFWTLRSYLADEVLDDGTRDD